MAYVQAAALVTRIREVLESSYGSMRQVPPSRFSGDIPDGLSLDEQMRRGLTAPRIQARVMVIGRSKSSPPVTGNVLIYDIKLVVKSLRTCTRTDQVDGTSNDTLVAASMVDADAIRQALEYPGNLAATEAGAVTDLVSGMLSFESHDAGEFVNDIDSGAQALEQSLTFLGYLIARPAVTTIPTNTVAPVISGVVSLTNTLTSTPGTWANTPTSYAYQWYTASGAILGATASTFVVTAGEVGASIHLTVQAINAAGGSLFASSNTLT